MSSAFGPDFVFGVATASYQIEGAVREDGRGPSIWDTFSHTPGKISDGTNGDVACDHYHRWESDLDLMVDLGVDAYRFSIAWSRIQPSGSGPVNQVGLDFYSRLVDGLLARGIQPFVTVYHWDLPQGLEDRGGWLNRDTAFRYGEYAGIVGAALGDRVATWATFNEPWCTSALGYGSGEHAPGASSPSGAVIAAHHLNLAHGFGVQALRSSGATGRVGVVCNVHQFYPASDDPADAAACDRVDAVANLLYTEPMLRGRYDPLTVEVTRGVTDWSFLVDGDLDQICQKLDYLGVNYYAPSYLAAGDNPAPPTPWPGDVQARWLPPRPPLTLMGWTVEPRGLTDVLVRTHERYPELPLVVTENGVAVADVVSPDGLVHDPGRVAYLHDHLEAVAAARAAGVPVQGYFVWSLMDNVEWAHGHTKPFGLYHVDYATQARTPKDSAHWYQQFVASQR